MKIALCLHGLFNSSRDATSNGRDGFTHIKKHILDGRDVDVFVHTWDDPIVIEALYGENIKAMTSQVQKDFTWLCESNGLPLVSNSEYRPASTIFSHFYSVQKSFELMLESEIEYDIVIKSRFDLGRINRLTSGPGRGNPYPVQCINFDPCLDMTRLHTAKWQYDESEGPADMWFYSNLPNMRHFATCYDLISEDMCVGSEYEKWAGPANNGMINPIKAWKWFLIQSDLWDNRKRLDTEWE